MKKWITLNVTAFCYLLMVDKAVASWAEMSDEQLLKFPIIVYGQYMGTSLIKAEKNSALTNLGVIKSLAVLKGAKNQNIYFIKAQSLNTPISSDMLFFKPDQTGIWFLQPVTNSQGLYQITHPSQYQYISEESNELERWKSLLK